MTRLRDCSDRSRLPWLGARCARRGLHTRAGARARSSRRSHRRSSAKRACFALGVDLDYPPFAGEDKGEEAGIDVDVAAAVAESSVSSLRARRASTPSEAATALADGDRRYRHVGPLRRKQR